MSARTRTHTHGVCSSGSAWVRTRRHRQPLLFENQLFAICAARASVQLVSEGKKLNKARRLCFCLTTYFLLLLRKCESHMLERSLENHTMHKGLMLVPTGDTFYQHLIRIMHVLYLQAKCEMQNSPFWNEEMKLTDSPKLNLRPLTMVALTPRRYQDCLGIGARSRHLGFETKTAKDETKSKKKKKTALRPKPISTALVSGASADIRWRFLSAFRHEKLWNGGLWYATQARASWTRAAARRLQTAAQ